MGMFDYVSVEGEELRCKKCGNIFHSGEFQSKDYLCKLLTIPAVLVNNFYAICRNCKTRNEWETEIEEVISDNKYIRTLKGIIPL